MPESIATSRYVLIYVLVSSERTKQCSALETVELIEKNNKLDNNIRITNDRFVMLILANGFPLNQWTVSPNGKEFGKWVRVLFLAWQRAAEPAAIFEHRELRPRIQLLCARAVMIVLYDPQNISCVVTLLLLLVVLLHLHCASMSHGAISGSCFGRDSRPQHFSGFRNDSETITSSEKYEIKYYCCKTTKEFSWLFLKPCRNSWESYFIVYDVKTTLNFFIEWGKNCDLN